ncbi:hypothetical protein M0805_006440 [Coniferiporia weirii]|nr:hypothetical protein M0805_006440 [Coniferiporia weirii]
MPTIFDEEPSDIRAFPSYFGSLSELDDWNCKSRTRSGSYDGLLEYKPRSTSREMKYDARGKLLVCHDYKGGYTESPSSLAYTFNFWDRCDTFIYFSHQRVTIPPPGWINAAHKQGVKMLGVLIFEHESSQEDMLRLLVGNIPGFGSSASKAFRNNSLPVSPYYARLLADLARERGFDGYLLNFEYPFAGKSEQVRALEAWISILNAELKQKVGDYAQTIWYDSIVITGDLRWQDRLNSRNVSFFLASDSFFTNYTWPSTFPSLSSQYLLSLDPALMQGRTKTLQDIFVGVDVWGRGSHGGGGLGAYRAIEHINPESMGLSLALFGPAWTWESDEGTDGWGWDTWWTRERTLWVGPETEGATVEVPDAPAREGEPPCTHGPFRPVSDFFPRMTPPNPNALPFFTSFCPGVGHAWFVGGREVTRKTSGWMDVDKQTSLGDQLWPRPLVSWDVIDVEETLPKATTSVDFTDAFNSGSSVSVNLTGPADSSDESSYRFIWIPVQSLVLSPGGLYEAHVIYKISSTNCEVDPTFSARSDIKDVSMEITELSEDSFSATSNGWNKLSITLKPTLRPDGSSDDILSSIGLTLGTDILSPSLPYTITIHLGQLSVSPRSSLLHVSPHDTALLWASCTRTADTLALTWDTCVRFTTPPTITPDALAPETPHPPWILDRGPSWLPRLLYANVYAETRRPTSGIAPSAVACFLGTSSASARFSMDRTALPENLRVGALRFFVQGVTDRGVVLPWDSCAFADFDW